MQYFGADGLGSVRQLYNSSGQIVFNKRYDPFGNTISQSGVGTSNYGYTGEWTDATGLEYLRARYYAPGQGRFVTSDVWPGDDQRPLTLNRWNYVQANPVNKVDPNGTFSISVINQSLQGKSLQEVFGGIQYGYARWGLYALLKDAREGDLISPLTHGSATKRQPDQPGFNNLANFRWPLNLADMGSYFVFLNGCELMFTTGNSADVGYVSLTQFVERIEEDAEAQNRGAANYEFWRTSTFANHWYALGSSKFYSDFGGKSELPDFTVMSIGIPIRGPAGITEAIIVDRYGNRYFLIGGGGGPGLAALSEGTEGYVDSPQIPDKSTLKNILIGWGYGVTAGIFAEAGGTYSTESRKITLQAGWGFMVGVIGNVSYTWHLEQNVTAAWNWVDEEIPGFSGP